MIFSNVIVAFDGSELSKKALLYALHIVRSNPTGSLHVIHVYPFPSVVMGEALIPSPVGIDSAYTEEAEAILNEAKSLTDPQQFVTFVLRQGQPAKDIIAYADEQQSDLIVMGSRGLGSFQELVLGSISHEIVQQSKIPVLVIK
ncbi:Stress response protein NhaX [compost metagenome]